MTQRRVSRHPAVTSLALLLSAGLLVAAPALAAAPKQPEPAREGDVVLRDFQFHTGDRLPELRMHYLTLGRPARNAKGEVTNAVLILHGTGGTGRQFLSPQFADELYGAGAPLDTTRFWIVLPDGIGHGHSSKPSDGLRMRFPAYDYDDMVEAQRRLLADGLGVRHLKLVMGTSMGGMHTFVWGVTHPEMMDALMPLGCQPVAIVGRNRVWRAMAIDAIKSDPAWLGGDYTDEPTRGLRTAVDLLIIAGSSPIPMQLSLATRDSADHWVEREIARRLPALDANDLLYQLDASRDYDPSPKLGAIRVPLVLVNSGDDFINPPELGIAEREVRRVPGARFVLVPASEKTHGHGTHTWAALWKEHLVALLAETAPH